MNCCLLTQNDQRATGLGIFYQPAEALTEFCYLPFLVSVHAGRRTDVDTDGGPLIIFPTSDLVALVARRPARQGAIR
jgi:hypothetical protein